MPTGTAVDPRARRLLRVGWVLVALLPVAFVGASLVGGWLLDVQGYTGTEEDLPASVALRAGLPAVVVLVAPLLGACWCGNRARVVGDPRGRVLLLVAGLLAVLMVGLNLVQVVVGWLVGA